MSSYNVQYILNLKDRVSGQLKGIQGQTGKLDKAFGGITRTLGAFGLAFTGYELITTAIKNAMEAEEVDKRLIETAQRLTNANNEQAQSLLNLADAVQARSRFGDEDIKLQQTALLQYGLTIDQVNKLTPVIADFAAATGQDLGGATQTVIKGMNGMTRGLKQYGLDLDMTGSKTENMTQLMEQLNQKFGGSAARDLETTAGRWESLKNSFGNFLETLGAASIEGEGGGLLGFLNDYVITADEGFKQLMGKQSEFTTNFNSVVRAQGTGIQSQIEANNKYIQSQLNVNGGIEGYLSLIQQGTGYQNQLNTSLNQVATYDAWGDITTDFVNYGVKLQAARETQAALIDQTREYVNGLDSVGQNQAFEKIAKQMNVATDQVRQFFAAMGQGGTPIEKTLTTVSDFEEEINRLKEAQKDVSDPAKYRELGKQIAANEAKMARITGKPTGGGTRAGGAGAGATSSTLTSRSPQTFNINITKLVETINTTKPQLNTTDSQTMRQITEALVMAVNDVQTTVQ